MPNRLLELRRFIQQCIDFTILAFCVFLMVKLMNR
ncbi:MAG: MscL family protein [Alistipes finegoldii]